MAKEYSLEEIIEHLNKPDWKTRVYNWTKRYAPAELLGTLSACLGYFFTKQFTDDEVASAYVATLSENIGFYGTMFVKDAGRDYQSVKQMRQRYRVKDVFKTLFNLCHEFGPAEYLDTALIRPGSIYAGTELYGGATGVIAGKIAADLIFYILPIKVHEANMASFEIRKHVKE